MIKLQILGTGCPKANNLLKALILVMAYSTRLERATFGSTGRYYVFKPLCHNDLYAVFWAKMRITSD